MDRPRSPLPLPRTRPPASEPLRHLVACGVGLSDLRVWPESRWDRTPPSLRPELAEHRPGLGWVVAVPLALDA
jgi:hypothetical protein